MSMSRPVMSVVIWDDGRITMKNTLCRRCTYMTIMSVVDLVGDMPEPSEETPELIGVGLVDFTQMGLDLHENLGED